MNTENLIKFIKKCKGLKNKINHRVLVCYLLCMLAMVYVVSVSFGKVVLGLSIVVSVVIIVMNVYFFILEKKHLKYKLLLPIVAGLNCGFPVFYVFCIFYCYSFGFLSFLLLYFVPFLLISFLMFLINASLMKRKFGCKTKVFATVSGGVFVGVGLLIGRKMNLMLSMMVGESVHFLIGAYMFMLLMSLVSSSLIFDLQRFYYFTKLEKAGLVTEDILKPEE